MDCRICNIRTWSFFCVREAGHTDSESATFLTERHNFFLCSWWSLNSGHWFHRIFSLTLPVAFNWATPSPHTHEYSSSLRCIVTSRAGKSRIKGGYTFHALFVSVFHCRLMWSRRRVVFVDWSQGWTWALFVHTFNSFSPSNCICNSAVKARLCSAKSGHKPVHLKLKCTIGVLTSFLCVTSKLLNTLESGSSRTLRAFERSAWDRGWYVCIYTLQQKKPSRQIIVCKIVLIEVKAWFFCCPTVVMIKTACVT